MTESARPAVGLDTASLNLLRRAGIERDDLGSRLAQHEFQAFKSEMLSASPFDLRVELSPDGIEVERTLTSGLTDPEIGIESAETAPLAPLPVPMGRITWAKRPEDLPVTGILVETLPPTSLAKLFLALMTEHHRHPFARLLLLCQDMGPVHVLGRYGFICHLVYDADLATLAPVFARRYGMSQVRSLKDGRKLWTSSN